MKKFNFFDQFTDEEVLEWFKNAFYSISEEYWSARWIINIEYIIWDAVHSDPPAIGNIQSKLILDASERIGGWLKWDSLNHEPAFITKEKWLLECLSRKED